MTPVITICCIKKGDKYGPEYVNILEAMVRRNVISTPYKFVCFTENATGIRPDIQIMPLPFNAPGWWAKMGLYMERIPGIETERLLFLDLDVVITGPLDSIMRYDSDFAMAKDEPTGAFPAGSARDQYGNTSVILLRVGAAKRIWECYCRGGKPETAWSDQGWINDHYAGFADLLSEKEIQSYKLHKLAGDAPPVCSVVIFHGVPKPPDCGGWVKEFYK